MFRLAEDWLPRTKMAFLAEVSIRTGSRDFRTLFDRAFLGLLFFVSREVGK